MRLTFTGNPTSRTVLGAVAQICLETCFEACLEKFMQCAIEKHHPYLRVLLVISVMLLSYHIPIMQTKLLELFK